MINAFNEKGALSKVEGSLHLVSAGRTIVSCVVGERANVRAYPLHHRHRSCVNRRLTDPSLSQLKKPAA